MKREVVGWSGTVISGGAGIKEAVIHDEASGLFGSTAPRAPWLTREELEDLAKLGRVTLRDLHQDAIPDGAVVYAMHDLVQPSLHDRLRLDPNPLVLYIVGTEAVWLGYMRRTDAIELLRRWADALLVDAHETLQERWGLDQEAMARRVLDSARRARFCVRSAERAQRYEIFKLLAIAARVRNQPLEPTYRDASIELAPEDLERLRADVASFVPDTRTEIDRAVPPIGRTGHPPRKHAQAA